MPYATRCAVALTVLLIAVGLTVSAPAQDAPAPKPEARQGGNDRPERGAGQRGGRQQDPGNWMQSWLQRDPSRRLITVVAQLNMTPQFTLSPAQKTRIQEIRDSFKDQRQAYRAQNQKQIQFIQAQIDAARQAKDNDAAREGWSEMRDLFADGPSEQELLQSIKGVLTETQLQAVEVKEAEWAEQMRKRREEREQRRRANEEQEPTI